MSCKPDSCMASYKLSLRDRLRFASDAEIK